MALTVFEKWWEENGEQFQDDLCHMSTYHMASVAFESGRESMQAEAINKLGDYEANKCAQIVAGIEL